MDEEFISAVRAANVAIHKVRYIRSDQIYEVSPDVIGDIMNLIRVCKEHIKATTPKQVKHDN